MRDPVFFSEENRWTEHDSDIADVLLENLRETPTVSNDNLIERILTLPEAYSHANVIAVLERMSTFPHMFEVANARRTLQELNLDGTPARPQSKKQKMT